MHETAIDLESIVQFLDDLLGVSGFPDYEGALNGLQIESPGPIRSVGAAVDAGIQASQAAVESGVGLLLVHHGIFWSGNRPMTGRRYRAIAPLIRSGVALYSAHLPLDAHPEFGNCALLTREMGLETAERFGRYEDTEIGFTAAVDESRESFQSRVQRAVDGPVKLIAGGPERVRNVGIVTGGGGSFIRAAVDAGLDTLVTGEGSHHTYLDAIELGVNVFYGGHYATETFGVRALAARIESEFGIPWIFLDFPSGL